MTLIDFTIMIVRAVIVSMLIVMLLATVSVFIGWLIWLRAERRKHVLENSKPLREASLEELESHTSTKVSVSPQDVPYKVESVVDVLGHIRPTSGKWIDELAQGNHEIGKLYDKSGRIKQ